MSSESGQQFYVRADERLLGPFTASQLKKLSQNGRILPSHLIGKTVQGPWRPASTIRGLEFKASDEARYVEGAANTTEPSSRTDASGDSKEWYINREGKQFGPLSMAQLIRLVTNGGLAREGLIRKDGTSTWVRADSVPSLSFPESTPSPPVRLPVIPMAPDEVRPTRPALMQMKGVQDLLEVFDDKITITPMGVLGFLNKGLKGTKSIPYESISAIQFREAGAALSGYLQFSVLGGVESRNGLWSAAKDENTVMFAGPQNNPLAMRIAEYVEQRMREVRTSPKSPRGSDHIGEELLKLAQLKKDGLLSDQEFETAKRRVLEQ